MRLVGTLESITIWISKRKPFETSLSCQSTEMISEKEIVSPTYESLGVEKFDSVSISQKVVCRFESHFVDISISGRYEQVYMVTSFPFIFHWCDICKIPLVDMCSIVPSKSYCSHSGKE